MAITKKAAETAAKATETTTTEVEAPVKETKPAKKKSYGLHDMIDCRSVTVGELICASKKTKDMYYNWADYGDVTPVEYQDLLAMKSGRSGFVMNPQFIIEDEELAQEWGLTALYNSFFGLDDPDEMFALGEDELRQRLRHAPEGFKTAIIDIAGKYVKNGQLDSVRVIKLLDAELGTNLKALL